MENTMRTLTLLTILFLILAFTKSSFSGEKVILCHKETNTINVSINAMNAHLSHGDTVGDCQNNDEDDDDGGGILENIIKRLEMLESRLENSDLDLDGFTPATGDCNDADAAVNPDMLEEDGDGVDNNCDGNIDEDDNP